MIRTRTGDEKLHYIFVFLFGALSINFCCDSTEVKFEHKEKILGNFVRVLQPAAGEMQFGIVWRWRFWISEVNICYGKHSVKLDDVADISVQLGYSDELFWVLCCVAS